MRIINYDTDKIRIIENSNNIFFLNKEDLSVSGVSGKITLTIPTNQFSYSFDSVESPVTANLDALVVAVREYIDNA